MYKDSELSKDILFITTNDGTELADILDSLDDFLSYAESLGSVHEEQVIKSLEPLVKEIRQELEEELKEMELETYLKFEELPHTCVIQNLDTDEKFVKFGNTLLAQNGRLVTDNNGDWFLIQEIHL